MEALLTDYGPMAGIWLDSSYLPQHDPERFAAAFDLPALYETIRERQPQTLISYKEGVTGTEDFVTPEHKTGQQDVLGEVCTTMIPAEAHRAGDDFRTGLTRPSPHLHLPAAP